MRTQRHSVSSDLLGRYYTNALVSEALVQNLPATKPKTILDLGAGTGALSLAASKRWTRSRIVTVDVDHSSSHVLPIQLRDAGFIGSHAHLKLDALSVDLPASLSHDVQPLDVAVCNPPFLIPKWRKAFNEILEDVGLSSCLPAISNTDAALLFLAQNLRLLRPGGVLGIIVPDSVASAEKYKRFRTELLTRFRVIRAIRLSRGSFGGTDALAHILVIENMAPNDDRVLLSCLDDGGAEHGFIEVDVERAAHRLDYQYHLAESRASTNVMRLSDVCLDLRRGSLNSAQAKSASHFVLHTTDLDSSLWGKWLDFSPRRFRFPAVQSGSITRADSGDIVIARVGRTAHQKVIGIHSGSVVLTDCLYRLRVQPSMRARVLDALCAGYGREWLESHAYGVAARQLTRSDLLNLPLSNI